MYNRYRNSFIFNTPIGWFLCADDIVDDWVERGAKEVQTTFTKPVQ